MKKIVAKFWRIFKNTPIGKVVRILAPQWLVNKLEHLPLAVIANARFNSPSKKLKVIGVTGTDGKTTTVNMIYQILKSSGKRVSMVSTINAKIGDRELDTGFHVTSPHSYDIQSTLSEAVKAGSEYMILEVTSHSLDQYRFYGVQFDMAVITNITHEHLDYHKTWENYFKAKSKLIKNVKVAVLNKDEKHFDRLSKLTSGKIISFGLDQKADFNPKTFPLKLLLPGEHNILNGLAAAAITTNLGIEKVDIKKALEQMQSLEGRNELIENKKGIKIYVDFAHTPNGLTQALKGFKSLTSGKVISLIGAEGERDVQKRPIMGEIAQRASDYVIVTAVDPRGVIDEINKQIEQGALKAGAKRDKNFFIINDRQEAIRFAIQDLAKKGDLVAIFGKGHEKSMNLDGKKEIPWSDKQAVLKVI